MIFSNRVNYLQRERKKEKKLKNNLKKKNNEDKTI